MTLGFHRRLAIPLWAAAFFAVGLMTPASATLSVIAVLGVAAIALTIPGLVPWLRLAPMEVPTRATATPRPRRAAAVVTGGAGVRTLDLPGPSTPEDVLDLVRMDDDGGWQMARPPI